MEKNELVNHILREVWECFCALENEDRKITNLIENSELGKNLLAVLEDVYADHTNH